MEAGMRVQLIILGAALALAACTGGEEANGADDAANAAEAAKNSSEAQKRVRELPGAQRNAVLIKAIQDKQHSCSQVESSLLSETSRSVPVYLATCEDGAVYAVAIADDGSANVKQVTPAEERKK
jgi:hypothetical protein